MPRPSRLLVVLAFVLTAGLPVACRREPAAVAPPDTNTVARVGEGSITVEALQQALARRGPRTTAADRQAVLDDLVRAEVLYQKARAAGFDQQPEMAARIRRLIGNAYEEHLRAGFQPAAVDAAAIEAYYRERTAEFAVPEKVRAAGVFLRVPRQAVAAKQLEAQQRAEDFRARAAALPASEKTLGNLALETSEDQATRYVGGDLGFLTRTQAEERWNAPAAEAVFALSRPGEVSPVVAVDNGLWIFRLIERTGATHRPLAEVRDLIAYRIGKAREAEAEQALFSAARDGIKIEINRALLETVPLPTPASTGAPPALPGR